MRINSQKSEATTLTDGAYYKWHRVTKTAGM